jgi:hypothetical protein
MTVQHYIHKAFRAEFVTSLLIAVFVFAMAHPAISDPAPSYNCGDRGVRYCIVEYSYPEFGVFFDERQKPRSIREREPHEI